jgi:hypothetical protein
VQLSANMTDALPGLFRSALKFINDQGIPVVSRMVNATTGVVSGAASDHPLVGQIIEVGQHKVKIQSLLAEGLRLLGLVLYICV